MKAGSDVGLFMAALFGGTCEECAINAESADSDWGVSSMPQGSMMIGWIATGPSA
jgi:hypothetical protein